MNIIQDTTLEYMQFINVNNVSKDDLEDTKKLIKALENGDIVRVRYNQDIDLYKNTDTTLYEYDAKAGRGDDAKIVKRHAVAIADAIRSTRVGVKQALQAKVDNLLAQGLITEDIAQALLNK